MYRAEPASVVPKTAEYACLFISPATHRHVFKATLVAADAETLVSPTLLTCVGVTATLWRFRPRCKGGEATRASRIVVRGKACSDCGATPTYARRA